MDRELFNRTSTKNRRRELRNDMPKAEQILWYHLKGKQLDGYKFRRQHGIGPYIIDFYCPMARLVIEIDGDSHFDPAGLTHDALRDRFLKKHGIKILHFTNTEVYDSMGDVLEQIRLVLRASNPL